MITNETDTNSAQEEVENINIEEEIQRLFKIIVVPKITFSNQDATWGFYLPEIATDEEENITY